MPSPTQYGPTPLLDGFHAGSSAKPLQRLHFSKNTDVSAPYNEAWLQNITPPGNLALAEYKLWRNSEARREVVAQILDYANSMSGRTY